MDLAGTGFEDAVPTFVTMMTNHRFITPEFVKFDLHPCANILLTLSVYFSSRSGSVYANRLMKTMQIQEAEDVTHFQTTLEVATA